MPNPSVAPPPGGCAVAAPHRPLLERLVLDIVRNGAWVANSSDDFHRGFGLTPFGSITLLGRLSVVRQCAGESASSPICGIGEVAGIAPLTGCYRGRCERAGVSLEDTYMALQGRTDPLDRHRVEYQSDYFGGRVVYDTNPFITYRVDLTAPGGPRVTADVGQTVSFMPQGGGRVDLSHGGQLLVTKSGTHIDRISVDLTLAGISGGGPAVRVGVELNSEGFATGAVSTSRGRIATITGGDRTLSPGPVYTWEGECAAGAP